MCSTLYHQHICTKTININERGGGLLSKPGVVPPQPQKARGLVEQTHAPHLVINLFTGSNNVHNKVTVVTDVNHQRLATTDVVHLCCWLCSDGGLPSPHLYLPPPPPLYLEKVQKSCLSEKSR